MRIPVTESLRVPGAGSSALGQSDPKPRPKGVGDGKRANIPAPEDVRYHPQGGRRSEGRAGRWSSRCKEVGGPGGEKTRVAETRRQPEGLPSGSLYKPAAEKSLGGECIL